MLGIIRLMLTTIVIVAAAYGLAYVWTGEMLPYMLEILGTFGIITLVCIIAIIVMKPASEKD